MMQLIAIGADVWLPVTVIIIIVITVGGLLTELFPPDRRG